MRMNEAKPEPVTAGKGSHPRDVLLGAQAAAPWLPVCDHYSGVESRMRKSLQLQAEMTAEFGTCVFDVTLDCEDGAPVGAEAEHAQLVAELALGAPSGARVAARVHPVDHPAFEADVATIVGRAGKQWAGATRIDGKYVNPAWAPPADVKHDNPSLPDVIPGGSPRNPMGVAAMTLAGGEYAIHGTNVPGSIGGFVSYGCIRMYNQDITDLYQRVGVGTPVVVTAR